MYNVESYIGRCLDSIFNQGMSENDYEIILINDGSTDGSLGIAQKYAYTHSQIHLIEQENRGQAAARNRGLALAKGKYVFFVDSDDILIPSSLMKIQEVIQDCNRLNENVDLITFRHIEGDYSESNFNGIISSNEKAKNTKLHSGYQYIEEYGYQNAPWWYIVRKDFLIRHDIKFEEGKFIEDAPFTTKVLVSANNIIKTDYIVYYYFYNAEGTMRTTNLTRCRKMIDGHVYAAKEITDTIKNHSNMPPKCKGVLELERDHILFGGLLTALKYGELKSNNETIKELKKSGLYPMDSTRVCFTTRDKMYMNIVNNRCLFFVGNCINSLALSLGLIK